MKNQLLPVAIGLVTAIVAPLQAKAADQPPIDFEQAPVSGPQADGAIVADTPTNETKNPPADLPVTPTEPAGAATPDPSGALSFEPRQFHAPASATSAQTEPSPNPQVNGDMFAGGSKSLVARTVGAAEGTRTADGGTTDNYHGHVDPGNGVWNRGTFSYQFGNEENLSPDEADRRQLAKIKRIHDSEMLPQAAKHGVAPLTLAEEVNGIDLINQAPLAVTESGGYVERLAQAKKEKGLTGEAAILEARVWAFWDAQKGGWDAPGLRAYDDVSKEESIRHDQERRMGMIAKALESYEKQGNVARSQPSAKPTAIAAIPEAGKQTPDAIANSIIFGTN